MAIIKTAQANEAALDWLVAKCEGREQDGRASAFLGERYFKPSTDWAFGGPIIDREAIQWCFLNGQIEAWSGFDYIRWRSDWDSPAHMPDGAGFGTAHTILVAAMCCYVTSKLGEEVEVPDEILSA